MFRSLDTGHVGTSVRPHLAQLLASFVSRVMSASQHVIKSVLIWLVKRRAAISEIKFCWHHCSSVIVTVSQGLVYSLGNLFKLR